MAHQNPIKAEDRKRAVDLHGPKAAPSELTSRLRGLQSRYAINQQLVGLLKTYGEAATLLLREYGASRAYPECCTVFQKSKTVAAEQGVMLRGVQLAIQKEIDELRGQLPMFKENEDERQ